MDKDDHDQSHREASQVLAGIFQQIAEDCKSVHPVAEEFLQASLNLQHSLKSTIGSFSLFLDSLQKISEKALNTKGSSKDIGECLKNIHDEHKILLKKISSFAKSLAQNMIVSVQKKSVELKKDVSNIDQAHWKEMKKMRISIKRKKAEIKKLNKKTKKDKTWQKSTMKNCLISELQTEEMVLEEQERQALRRINLAERSFYQNFASGLQLVLAEEMKIFGQSINISQESLKLEKITNGPDGLPPSADEFISDLVSSGQGFIFITPPPSPRGSLMRSWGGSVMSIASLIDNSPTSPKQKRFSKKKGETKRLVDISERLDTTVDDEIAVNPVNLFSKKLDLDKEGGNNGIDIEKDDYFTRKSPQSSGYGSSPGKSDTSDEDLSSLKFLSFENAQTSPMRKGSLLSSFQSDTGRRLETFYEDFETNDINTTLHLNNSYKHNPQIARSSSFGSNYPDGPRYQRIDRTQSLRPRRNSEVVTNLQDHIRLLDDGKSSIMNMMDEAFWN